MKQKQCSIDFFFSPKKDTKKSLQPEITQIQTQKIEKEIDKQLTVNSLISDIPSRGSSPPPATSLKSFGLIICPNEKGNEIQKEENQSKNIVQALDNEEILTPSLKITVSDTKNELNDKNCNHDNTITMNQEKEKNLHWELEVIEHRIQFGKDLEHPHPCMAPNVLQNEGLHDVRPREKTRLKHYDQVDYIECIPDFWEPRVWDDNYPKLDHTQSEFLLESMIQAPFKEKSDEDSEYESPYSDYSSSSSSPLTSASNSSSDEENDRSETKNVRRPRIRFGFIQSNRTKKSIQNPVPLRITSLLFDTDNEIDTDLEDF